MYPCQCKYPNLSMDENETVYCRDCGGLWQDNEEDSDEWEDNQL